MASPPLRATPLTARSPEAANGLVVAGDEAIWKRLREAGFDEESVKRRDKAALIAYITKLETEIHDYQYHMGLLILERKEWTSKYEEVKASAESAEIVYKRDQAANLSALAEAKKCEESLKKALRIEKECVADIEKALHDMRAEAAEKKLACESKLSEAHKMMETAQKKFDEAENKMIEAESMHAEARRSLNSASIRLQDVEAREDDLRRQIAAFKSEYDAKEREINLQRDSLYDRQRILHQEQHRLQEAQSLLNHREEYIFKRTNELKSLEKELEEAKANAEEERRALKEQKSNLDLDVAALATRDEAVVKRETLIDKKERELLILQEKIANREYDKIQKLADEHQLALEKKRTELETEIEKRRMAFEDEVEIKRSTCKVKEAELNQREEVLREQENSLELNLMELVKKQEDLTKRMKLFEEKEQILQTAQEARELEMLKLQEEREEIKKMKDDMERVRASLEDKEREISLSQKKLELTESERNELLVLETKLKEEIDSFRAQRIGLDAEADKLKAEKEKFETEWELIDEKREELRKEIEIVAEERKAVSTYLKNEHDSLKLEKENLHNRFRDDVETLSCEKEEFVSKMQQEHSEWFSKIQQERDDFVKDMKIQRKELENCIEKRREEIESYLREKEESFEEEKTHELQHINSQKEMIAKEMEHLSKGLKMLENEKLEMARDREQREREWSEMQKSIEELNTQCEKLQRQRELLHADREGIDQQIQHLKKLEDLEIESESRALSEIKPCNQNSNKWKVPVRKCSNVNTDAENFNHRRKKISTPNANGKAMSHNEKTPGSASPPVSATLSWLRKCSEVIFKRSPEKATTYGVEIKFLAKPEELSSGKKNRYLRSGSLKNKNPGGNNNVSCLHGQNNNNEDTSQDVYEEASRPDGVVNSSLAGRKRPNSRLSNEHADIMVEPSKKLQRKLKQKDSDDVEETTDKSNSSKDVPHSADKGLGSFNYSVQCKETSNCCRIDEIEPLEIAEKQLHESSKSFLSNFDAHENGRVKGSENFSHVANGGFSPGSYLNGVLEKKEKELIADEADKIREQDGCEQGSDDEVDADDELSIKSKLWNFLIT